MHQNNRVIPVQPVARVVLVLGVLLRLSSAGLSAEETGSIVGQVSPPHEHAFTLATAAITELGLRVEVADDGSFRFESVRAGEHLVEVRVPTLGSSVGMVEVVAGREVFLQIDITPGSHFEEVVVSAPGVARDALDMATPVVSLSGQELQLRTESSLGETLANEPGVSSTFFGPGASRPIIRGLSGDRVRVLEGGIGSGDASGVSADHAVTTDPSQAERIEVLRGPATLLYGSSAIGGAVNVIDGRIPNSRASRKLEGSVDLRAGTVSDQRSGAFDLKGGAGSWAWHLDAFSRQADDYEVPGFARVDADPAEQAPEDPAGEEPFGFVPSSDLEARGARAGVTRFFGASGFFGASFSGFDSDYGIPNGGESEEEEDQGLGEAGVRIDMEQERIDLRGELQEPFGIFRAAKFRLGATDYEHVELEGEEEGTFFFNDFLETRFELVQKRRGGSTGTIGLQYSDRDLEALGEEAFIPRSLTDRWAVFTFQELVAGSLRWQFGGRYEAQDNEGLGVGLRSHDGVSASVGLVHDLTNTWSIGGSLARSVKLPAAEELFSNGPHAASQSFEIGDPDLREESGRGLDLSLRRSEGKLTGELTLFQQDFSDFIFQSFTGEMEEGFPVALYSQSDARFSGVEIKGRVELLERDGNHLHVEIVGDLVDAALAGGEHLPRIPPLRLGGGIHYHSERWSGMTEVRWVDAQTSVAVNETPTEGYTMLNASVGYRLLFEKQILDLLLRGRNLTNEEARSHTSFLKDFAPLPGRDLRLSLRVWF